MFDATVCLAMTAGNAMAFVVSTTTGSSTVKSFSKETTGSLKAHAVLSSCSAAALSSSHPPPKARGASDAANNTNIAATVTFAVSPGITPRSKHGRNLVSTIEPIPTIISGSTSITLSTISSPGQRRKEDR